MKTQLCLTILMAGTVYSQNQNITGGFTTSGSSLTDGQLLGNFGGVFQVVKDTTPGFSPGYVMPFKMSGAGHPNWSALYNTPLLTYDGSSATGSSQAAFWPGGFSLYDYTDTTGDKECWAGALNGSFEFGYHEAWNKSSYLFYNQSYAPLLALKSGDYEGGAAADPSTLTLYHEGVAKIVMNATTAVITANGSPLISASTLSQGLTTPVVSTVGVRGGNPGANNYFFTSDSTATHISPGVLKLGNPGGSGALGGSGLLEIRTTDGGSSTVDHITPRYGNTTNWKVGNIENTPRTYASLVAGGQFYPVAAGGAQGAQLTSMSLKTQDSQTSDFFKSALSETRYLPTEHMAASSTLSQSGVGAVDANGRAQRNPMFNVSSSLSTGAVSTNLTYTDPRSGRALLTVSANTPAAATNTAPGVTAAADTSASSKFEVRHPGSAVSAAPMLSIIGNAGGSGVMTVTTPATFSAGINVTPRGGISMGDFTAQ